MNWDKLSRTSRDKYPEEKKEISLAKEAMDAMLQQARDLGISSSKCICYFQGLEFSRPIESENSQLIVSCQETLGIQGAKRLVVEANSNTIIIDKEFKLENLNDSLFNSDFKNESLLTSELLCSLLDMDQFTLHLVYINTKLVNENSSISINNMKQIINNYALSKTRISIFYADTLNKGLKSFVELNEADFIVRELNAKMNLNDLNVNFAPTLLISSK
jgi:hypothetical protein